MSLARSRLRAMDGRVLWSLLAILLAGVAIRIGVALQPVANAYDLQSFDILRAGLRQHPLDVYGLGRWPYPPLYFAWIVASAAASRIPGLSYYFMIKAPAMAADIALAAIAFWYLLRAGVQSPRRLLGAAALIALGPSFFAISAYHGQFDSLAILPAVLAVLVWNDQRTSRTALLAGVLLGLGGAVKTVPLLMLLALLPTARSWTERALLVVPALAIPGLLLLPFLYADPAHVLGSLRYTGLPGVGGISLLAQPGLARSLLISEPHGYSDLTLAIARFGGPVTLLALLALASLLRRRRTDPLIAAVTIWLCVFAVAPNFFFQYLIWGLPFFILAGHIGKTLLLEVAVLVPTVLFEFRPWPSSAVFWIYLLIMVAVWVSFALSLLRSAWAVSRLRPAMT